MCRNIDPGKCYPLTSYDAIRVKYVVCHFRADSVYQYCFLIDLDSLEHVVFRNIDYRFLRFVLVMLSIFSPFLTNFVAINGENV